MQAPDRPSDNRGGAQRAGKALLQASAFVAACLCVVVAVVAGTGWLYLLREFHGLAAGPRFDGALPLQQLARGDAQPLLRMIVAWLPAGLALGASLGLLTRLPRLIRAAVTAFGSAVLLLLASAVSDAIAENDSVSTHVSNAFSRDGVWLAVGLVACGVLIAPPWSARDRGAGATP